MNGNEWSTAVTAPLDDSSQWSIVHSRFRDPLDFMAAAAPDDPIIQMMLEKRAEISRTYDEILASVPEGLTRRERDEYVSARVMRSITSGVSEYMARTEDTDEAGDRP